ncbi:uncharacterized protein LOC131947167 [Physella acuta]|uniref:uncharacterized protein LOC131947167 n=1 Tax=Physella acuta TaxID=109671 RepID=UPI0027DD2FDC|nr:uncharacterized protein LOC131947167 [Physella acuta]XP_059164276.1 uncharacterized protein LOC131947167 [Physella acuta]XP_059164277.1 uncharacterized protein LOC131947167 [Physella acuta]XP_059164278.1 uncharacterized protein LOC131947167 [Physella acuta]XP_059164279.1 uncharacterized protein LOC131947167 [Physella acuta]
MGQSSSSQWPSSTATRGKSVPLVKTPPPPASTTQEPPPPASLPVEKTPTYAIAENKVLPNGVSDITNVRRSLRPVSQDMTKFHPEFADIFHYDSDVDVQSMGEAALERSASLSGLEKENMSLNSGSSPTSTQLLNGLGKQHFRNNSLPALYQNKFSDDSVESREDENSDPVVHLRRVQSMDRDLSQPSKPYRHKRQTSLTSGVSIQESVIHEDPREHLYNVARHEPFSNLMPSTASLPVKSSFDLDYSFNVTYAQLAEHRRQKRTAELKEKTGQKLEALEAEINASSLIPKSPFDRKNLGLKSSTHSISTGSSETGVSKSKKKKSPAPPPPAIPPFRYSLTNEPPIDYDMKEATPTHTHKRSSSSISGLTKSPAPQPTTKTQPSTNLPTQLKVSSKSPTTNPPTSTHKRSSSSISGLTKSPAPQPIPKTQSSASLQTQIKVSTKKSSPSPPPPASLQRLFATPKLNTGPKEITPLPGLQFLQKSKEEAKKQLEALTKLDHMLKEPKVVSATIQSKDELPGNNNVPPSIDHDEAKHQNSTETVAQQGSSVKNISAELCVTNPSSAIETKEVIEIPTTELEPLVLPIPPAPPAPPLILETTPSPTTSPVKTTTEQNETKTDSGYQFKRMNSLLQHDIVLAAQARGAKIKTGKPPVFLEKPKDASEMFRSELAKAASAREERRKEEEIKLSDSRTNLLGEPERVNLIQASPSKTRKNINKQQEKISIDTSLSKNSSESGEQKQTSEDGKDEVDTVKAKAELDQEFNQSNAGLAKRSSIHSEDMSISSSNTSQRLFSPEWTPEHDLESDDDIMDESQTMSHKRVSSEGFKSTIIPTKLNDLKQSTAQKKKKEDRRQSAGDKTPDERQKFGSIRKFKKSVHQGMRNAFGSISKASGKILKKQKSQELFPKAEPALHSSHSEVNHSPDITRDSNWSLSDSRSGSLRRSYIDTYSYDRKDHADSTSSSESDSDDIGDIDFASGIDDNVKVRHVESQPSSDVENKVLKRAGVAYVGKKGQIIVLPEYNTVDNSEQENSGHAPKLFNKKSKKFSYESTLRREEKSRKEKEIAREIREKEQQIEIERQKQMDIEKGYRRLRELEDQENLQKMQTAVMKGQIAQLHAQQHAQQLQNKLNNNMSSLPNLNDPSLITSPFISNGQVQGSQFSNGGVAGFINSPTHLSNGGVAGHGFINNSTHFGTAPHLPVFSTPMVGPNFTAHPAPIVGGSMNGGPTLPNLSPQELNQMSEYMLKLGVPPPTNQHQWAVLLSTITLNSSGFPGLASPQNGFYGSGPDLSHIFAGGKTMDSLSSKRQSLGLLAGQQTFQPMDMLTLQRLHADGLFYKSMHVLNSTDGYNQPNHQPTLTDITGTNPRPSFTPSTGHVIKQDTPDIHAEPAHRPTTDSTIPVNSQALTYDNHSHVPRAANALPPKVYGPMGFRPVSFHAGST